jgi:ABC-2 type transport system ATP-binding protein
MSLVVIFMETMIHVQNISKRFTNTIAVENISFDIKKGELVSLLGPNGAGKSTTINILCTIMQPDEGTASIGGLDVTREKALVKRLISVMPQELVFYDQLSAVENLVFFAVMHGVPKDLARTRAVTILEQLGLGGRKDAVKHFSGGMKRRLNLGICAIMDARVLFLDEPSAGLDPQSKHHVWEYLNELKTLGKTIILTTHDMNEAEKLSDRVIIIDHGKVIAEGTPADLKERHGNETVLELELVNGYRELLVKKLETNKEFYNVIKVNESGLAVFMKSRGANVSRLIKADLLDDLEHFESMNIRQGTLEDVFLNLTGRRLRE